MPGSGGERASVGSGRLFPGGRAVRPQQLLEQPVLGVPEVFVEGRLGDPEDLGDRLARGLPGPVVVIGDPDDLRHDHAFTVTNGGEAEFVVSLRYEYDRDPPGEAGVSFAAYDASGARLADGRESMAVTLAPGQTAYVTVTINTHGTTAQVDLSGSLALRAVGPDRPAQ